MAEAGRRARWSGATLGAAVALGAIVAILLLVAPDPGWRRALRRSAAVEAILDPSPEVRRRAWESLAPDLRDDLWREAIIAEIEDVLEERLRTHSVPDPALADLARALAGSTAWRWDRPTDRAILVRSIELAATGEPPDAVLATFAAERLAALPDGLALPVAPEVAAALWSRLDPPMQARLLPRLASLADGSRRRTLALLEPPDDRDLAGRLLLARWLVDGDRAAAIALASDPALHPDLLDRSRAAAVRLDPRAAIGVLDHLDAAPDAPWATILAPASAESAVRAAIERRAAEGEPASRRLLARLDAVAAGEPADAEGLAAAWDLLADPTSPADLRRVAALLLLAAPSSEDLPESALASLLEGAVAGESGSVLPSALLAEATDRTRLASAWLRSLEDDRKRAGAILAVLLDGRSGADLAAIARTQSAASEPRVRSLLRAASWALAAPRDLGAGDADREFVHRISHDEAGGEVDPDVLALRLAAGEPAAVEDLLALPREPTSEDPEAIAGWSRRMAIRWLLVERFVPDLAAALGPPLGGSRRERALERDLALVEWWSLRPDLRFDPSRRRWVLRRSSSDL